MYGAMCVRLEDKTEYGCDEHRTRRGSETLLPEYEPDAVSKRKDRDFVVGSDISGY